MCRSPAVVQHQNGAQLATLIRVASGPHPVGPTIDACVLLARPVEYVIVWRYRVAPKHRDAFEHAYGPRGAWVALFATAGGYRGTDLVRGDGPGEYLTIDHWESRAYYDAFRSERSVDYERLDAQFEALTDSESLVFEGTLIAP
jgi:heme-degrading monooxygenase HmoA